jgi:hypothetical protein
MAVPFPVMSLPSHSASRAPDRKRDRLPVRMTGCAGWFREKGTAGRSAGPYELALYWLRERSAWFILVW